MENLLIKYFEDEIKENNKQNKQNENKVIKQGISVYHKGIQIVVWAIFSLMIISAIASYVLSLYYKKNNAEWVAVVDVICILAYFVLAGSIILICKICSSKYIKKNIEEDKKLLDFLKECIGNVYGKGEIIQKVEELIKIYDSEIAEIKEHNSNKIKVIAAIISTTLAGITTLFTSSKDWEINIRTMLTFIFMLIIFASAATICIYLSITISPTLNKYQTMVSRLRHLHIKLIGNVGGVRSNISRNNNTMRHTNRSGRNSRRQANNSNIP